MVQMDTHTTSMSTPTRSERLKPQASSKTLSRNTTRLEIVSSGAYDCCAPSSTGLTIKSSQGHDVLQFPHNQAVNVTFRFQADQFTGHMVQHCHLLFHEDWGMMTQYDITGKEGATWDYAKVLDPQCVPPMGSKSHKSKSSKTM